MLLLLTALALALAFSFSQEIIRDPNHFWSAHRQAGRLASDLPGETDRPNGQCKPSGFDTESAGFHLRKTRQTADTD